MSTVNINSVSKKIRRKHGKKYINSYVKVEQGKVYKVKEAFELLPQIAYAKFDESVEVALNLGIDPKQSDQMVRGAVVLPHGIGKTTRVAVITKGEKIKDAQNAGADFVGGDDLIQKIQEGFLGFDKLVATPDMMVAISKVGKILGPAGLMPNPKTGTVTMDVAQAVKDQKAGKVEYRSDKAGIIHLLIGKKSFGSEKLRENFSALMSVIVKAKPPTSKGAFLRRVTLSTSMSPGLTLDTGDVAGMANS